MDAERVTSGDVDLYCATAGEEGYPPVVLLHGFSGNHLSWWQQVPSLAPEYRCLVPDQRGFGRSADRPDGPGPAAFVDDLRAVVDRFDADRVALVGHSMSGWPAVSFATRWPERVAALVLSGTPGGLLSPDRHAELQAAAEPLPDPDPLLPELAYLSEAITAMNDHGPASFEEVRPTLEEFPADAERIVEAGVPTLLVAGEADPFVPPPALDALADELGDPETATIAEAGHSANFERPRAFNRVILEFLDGVVL